MLWGEPADEEGAKFKARELPLGEIDPGRTEVISVRYVTPEPTGQRAGGTSGVEASAGIGEAAGSARLSPARREIVRKYFSQEGAPNE